MEAHAKRTPAGLESGGDFVLTPLPSASEMAAMDQWTIQEHGTPSLQLMERAGRAIYFQLQQLHHSVLRSPRVELLRQVVILCGKGNNGGDGLVVARLLLLAGYSPVVVLPFSDGFSHDNAHQQSRFAEVGGSLENSGAHRSPAVLRELLKKATCIVDCLLGSGQKLMPEEGAPPALRSPLKEIIDCVGEVRKARAVEAVIPTFVAIDIPTGLDGSSGTRAVQAFEADHTLALQCVKRGCLSTAGAALCGELHTLPIGIRTDQTSCEFALVTPPFGALPPLASSAHKGSKGRVVVVGGSLAMQGAPILSGSAALATGAGTVVKAHHASLTSVPVPPELMLALAEMNSSSNAPAATFTGISEHLATLISTADCVVIGPGLGASEETAAVVREALTLASGRCVIDADALNLLALDESLLPKALRAHTVLTPHPGEAARLLRTTTAAIVENRYAALNRLIERYECAVVLKGDTTLVGSPESEQRFVIQGGVPALGTAGSGDVLSGIIAAMVSLHGRALDPFSQKPWAYSMVEGALRGSCVHLKAATRCGKRLLATDIIRELRTLER